jgi:hypothetical protein
MARYIIDPYSQASVQIGDDDSDVYLRGIELAKSSLYGDGNIVLTVESDVEVYDICVRMDLKTLVGICTEFLKEMEK